MCPCAHQGAAVTHSVEEFCALGEANTAGDPFYTSQVSDLASHLSLPASASAPSSPIHSYQRGTSSFNHEYLLIHLPRTHAVFFIK